MTIDYTAIGGELLAAADTRTPVPLLTARYPNLSWDDVRAVARATDARRLSRGERRIGWKLGWTSAVMREALGVDRPNWGTLWESQLLESQVELSRFIGPKIEPELVWRSPVRLADPAVSADEVADLGGAWALGLEVVDPRYGTFDFDALDNTADNSSSAGVRVGPFVPLDTDPGEITIEFHDGGEPRSGRGSEAMGSPNEAVAWLARSLADEGLAIEAGDLIFTGGLARPFDGAPGLTLEVRSGDGPPGVELRFV